MNCCRFCWFFHFLLLAQLTPLRIWYATNEKYSLKMSLNCSACSKASNWTQHITAQREGDAVTCLECFLIVSHVVVECFSVCGHNASMDMCNTQRDGKIRQRRRLSIGLACWFSSRTNTSLSCYYRAAKTQKCHNHCITSNASWISSNDAYY